MDKKECWLQWAIELQSLAQIGLNYCKDIYMTKKDIRGLEIFLQK